MSFWSKAGLAAAGVAAGWLAARRGPRLVQSAQELAVRPQGRVEAAQASAPTTVTGGPMATFWNSRAAAPLRGTALRAVRFAATVRQGMSEKEEELTRRYAAQKEDLRPGSLDSWDRPVPGPAAGSAPSHREVLGEDFFTGSGRDPQDPRPDSPQAPSRPRDPEGPHA